MRLISFKINAANWLWIAVGFVATFITHKIAGLIFLQNADTVVVLFCCVCLFYFTQSYKQTDIVKEHILKGTVLFLSLSFLYNVAYSYMHIPEWDFLCFYLFAKAGKASNDFYSPEVYARVFNELNLSTLTSEEYKKEIVNVGFWYPPPAMFVFSILGFFTLSTGYIIWQTFIILFLIIDIVLLTRFYLTITRPGNTKEIPAIIALILVLLFPNFTDSIFFGQTVSLLLLLLLPLIFYINSWKAGVFAAILVIIKPLAAFFILYFIFFKKWKAVTAAAITGIVILAITALTFGAQNFINYFASPPTNRIPDFVYFEYSSLFGIFKRIEQKFPDYLNPANVKIIYYLLSACLVVATFWVLRKLHRISNTLAFIVFIPLTLLIYPATLAHYSILLLPVVLYIFSQKLFNNNWINLLFVFLLYLVGSYNFFVFNLFLWLILVNWPFLSGGYKENATLNRFFFKQLPITIK